MNYNELNAKWADGYLVKNTQMWSDEMQRKIGINGMERQLTIGTDRQCQSMHNNKET